jgi:hypothetical protein
MNDCGTGRFVYFVSGIAFIVVSAVIALLAMEWREGR